MYRIILILIISIFWGCAYDREIETIEEYMAWLNNEENGLVRIKYVNGLQLKVKYLPPEYLVFNELSESQKIIKEQVDSLLGYYNKSLTFVMTIGPDEREQKGNNIMFQGIKNYKEYKERLYNLNFYIENNVLIKTGINNYSPVLTNLENVYELHSSRNIIFVFVPSEINQDDFYKSDKIDFIFEDELFYTGINHFLFKRKDINNSPKFIFWDKL